MHVAGAGEGEPEAERGGALAKPSVFLMRVTAEIRFSPHLVSMASRLDPVVSLRVRRVTRQGSQHPSLNVAQ